MGLDPAWKPEGRWAARACMAQQGLLWLGFQAVKLSEDDRVGHVS